MTNLFPERIETDRLVMEPMHEVDVHRLYEICAEDDGIEDVTEYMPWDPHDTPKETAEFLEHQAEQWEECDSAGYVIRPGKDEDGAGEIAGSTALHVDWDKQLGTIGLWLRKPFWGRGYSGERAGGLLAVAFDHVDLEMVSVTHQAGNEKSRRAIEKYVDRFGGRHEGLLRNFEPANLETGGAVDAHRYTIAAEEFEANRGEPPTVTFDRET
ncbi:GCN5-related N-acetyltransferase [Salinarchaeum sp. Harcht-Bsk1]|uniref:GNAT family N-acetyltransferase n=1 Tax=Salinarchaeum sp. Harcht-Bsk1 TaxID=1333523 RepID=UPI000342319D|nr:GNAT family protein [Salinarchaeum sp. Harcht-Bsk1]AGN02650.1 GCN5-related N-acetyltransferase [Salinarchaeum sp. Harcht-Bsk1]